MVAKQADSARKAVIAGAFRKRVFIAVVIQRLTIEVEWSYNTTIIYR